MEKINNSKSFRIVLSILIAIAIWLYVDIEKAAEVATWVRNVPVEFSSENTTLADRGLMLLSGYDTTVDLKLKAPRKELVKLDRSKVRIVVDVGSVKEAGVQSLGYQVYYPDNISRSSMKVEEASAYSVTVTVGELHTKTVPIKCEITGEAGKDFTVGEAVLDPLELTLRGQRDDLLNVSYAKIRLDISGAEKSIVQAAEYELYDYNDVPIENVNIRGEVDLIQVTLPITTVKEVPLSIHFIESPGSTLEQVKYSIYPATVQLSGEKATLDVIKEIVLDTIYLQDLQDTQSLEYEIPLPEHTSLQDGAGSATVTIVVSGVSEKTVTVDQISCEKLASGFSAELETESLEVTLHGLTKDLDELTAQDVRITADLSGVTEEGLTTVPASVEISGSSHVAAKGSYQIIVNVTKSSTTN